MADSHMLISSVKTVYLSESVKHLGSGRKSVLFIGLHRLGNNIRISLGDIFVQLCYRRCTDKGILRFNARHHAVHDRTYAVNVRTFVDHACADLMPVRCLRNKLGHIVRN